MSAPWPRLWMRPTSLIDSPFERGPIGTARCRSRPAIALPPHLRGAKAETATAYGGGWTFDRSGIVGSARRDTYEGELTEAANAARASADDSIGQFHHLRSW
jgi:hypothetical protein